MAKSPMQSAETPDTDRRRRKTPRTEVPSIEVEISGERHYTKNWSLGGCLVAKYTGSARPGDGLEATLFLRIGREHQGLLVRAEVVRYRTDQDNALALRFLDLDIKRFGKLVDEMEV